jgi:hypothetical protein
MGIIAEKNDKEAAHENEQRGAGRVGDLELVAAGDELTAVPETAGRLHRHDKDGACNQSHDPASHIVRSIKIHIG